MIHAYSPQSVPSIYCILESNANGTGRSACATLAPSLLAVRQENIALPSSEI